MAKNNRQRTIAAQAIAAGWPYREAAKRAHVAPRTVRKWRTQASFDALVTDYADRMDADFEAWKGRCRRTGIRALHKVLARIERSNGDATAAQVAALRLVLARTFNEPEPDPFDRSGWTYCEEEDSWQ